MGGFDTFILKTQAMTHKVTATRLNVRAAGSPTAPIVTILSQHDLVNVTTVVNGWGQTDIGWVSMAHVQPAAMPRTLADTALQIARTEIGQSEQPKGSNWGDAVKKYLASVGIGFPAPWCMAFVYWSVDKAAKELGQQNPLARTGGVMPQWNASKKLRVTTPRKGDLFVMSFGKGLGHIGFVDSVQGDRIQTVEGNSNDEGSREGFEVCRKPGGRLISSCIGFIRI